MKILVADDSRDARESIAIVLRMKGHDVVLAGDGGNAIAIMGAERPDAVILDLMMPIVNGWEFLDWIVASPFRNVPVLILSGWTETQQPIPPQVNLVGVVPKGGGPMEMIDLLEEAIKKA